MVEIRQIGLWQVTGWAAVALLALLLSALPAPTLAGEGPDALSSMLWATFAALVVLLLCQLAWAVRFRRGRRHESLDDALDRVAPKPPAIPTAARVVRVLEHVDTVGTMVAVTPAAPPRSLTWRVAMTLLYVPLAPLLWSAWKLLLGSLLVAPLHTYFPQYDKPIALCLAALSTAVFFLLLAPFVLIWRSRL